MVGWGGASVKRTTTGKSRGRMYCSKSDCWWRRLRCPVAPPFPQRERGARGVSAQRRGPCRRSHLSPHACDKFSFHCIFGEGLQHPRLSFLRPDCRRRGDGGAATDACRDPRAVRAHPYHPVLSALRGKKQAFSQEAVLVVFVDKQMISY